MASAHEEVMGEPRPRPRSADSSPLRMARLIEGEIIPRLLLAHRAERDIATPLVAAFTPQEATAFAHLTLQLEVFALLARIETHIARGVPIDTIYLDLLAPAARVLGDFWDNDVCDFVDVTMAHVAAAAGDSRARQPRPLPQRAQTRADRRVLFTVPPGDQHSLGLVMIEDFFRRAGWRTWSAADAVL